MKQNDQTKYLILNDDFRHVLYKNTSVSYVKGMMGISKLLLGVLMLLLLQITLMGNTASAAVIPAGCPGTKLQGPGTVDCSRIPRGCPGSTQQGPVSTAPTNCPYSASTSAGNPSAGASSAAGVVNKKNDCRPNAGEQLNKTNCGIINMIVIITNILSGIVGVIIVIMITVGGIQYTVAGADPQKVTAAKLRIRSALLALFVYIFMFAFLQWIVPGGLF